jgi:hypothetical protein
MQSLMPSIPSGPLPPPVVAHAAPHAAPIAAPAQPVEPALPSARSPAERPDTPQPLAAADHVVARPRVASEPSVAPAAPVRRSRIRPWMVILAILLIGGAAAIFVGMSGPDLRPHRGSSLRHSS